MKLVCLLLLFFTCTTTRAQRVENLVFEGAGIRGIAYAGVVKELEERHLLDSVKKVGGTSAGAIIALLISLKYSSAEIEQIIGSTNFKRFNDGRYFFVGGLNRLNRHFGWYRGKRLEAWLDDLIKAKAGSEMVTFAQLQQRGFKDLYITGTNLNKQKLVVFSAASFPQLNVRDAVRISMSIPLYFEPLYLTEEGAIVRRPTDKDHADVLLDGGFIANYPIKLFDADGKIDTGTLGFRIDRAEQIIQDKTDQTLAPMKTDSFSEYMGAFYNLVIEKLNRQTLTAADWQRTVSIPDGAIGPRIRKLTEKEIALLVENGRTATREKLAEQ